MIRIRSTAAVSAILFALAVLAIAPLPAQDDVTIYRCTDAGGHVVIGNVPCVDGTQQDVRSMVRPVDGEPSPVPDAPRAPEAAPPPTVQYVVAQPPQPLYECVRPDGSVYQSDSGDGEPRWVPLWTTGYPVGIGAGPRGRPGHGGHGDTGGHGRGDIGSRGPTVSAGNGLSAPPISRISIPPDPPRPNPGSLGSRPRPPHGGHGWPGGAGTWERDECHVLPVAETCARLADRRDAIRTRFFNAQQRERDILRVEERGLNARIDRDCRTY